MPKHFYGNKPDKKDERDYLFRTLVPTLSVPPVVDLRPKASPVRDQGQLGSCTGFAIAAGLREFMMFPLVPMSPLWLYYQERVLEGSVGEDAGAEIRDGMKVLQQMGCATEKAWPYKISKFTKKPSCTSTCGAKKYVIGSYHRLLNLEEIKLCLAATMGYVLGFTVYESFESAEVERTGIVPMPEAGEMMLGGHAVFGVGYDDNTRRLTFKNSWGTGWGDAGYFTLPYEYLEIDPYIDIWTGI